MNNRPTIEGVTVYVVINLRSRELLYKGTSSYEAAEQSTKGTCFGYGLDDQAAHFMACQIADRNEVNRERKRAERREGMKSNVA